MHVRPFDRSTSRTGTPRYDRSRNARVYRLRRLPLAFDVSVLWIHDRSEGVRFKVMPGKRNYPKRLKKKPPKDPTTAAAKARSEATRKRVRTPDQKSAQEKRRAELTTMDRVQAGGVPPKRRRPKSRRPEVIMPQIMVDAVALECLDIAALQRRCSRGQLVRDILTGWITVVCDTRQAIFRETLPRGFTLPPVYEAWPGYAASLGFRTPDDVPSDDALRAAATLPPDAPAPATDEPPATDRENVLPPDEPLARPTPPAQEQRLPQQGHPATILHGQYRPTEREPISPEERDFLAGFGGTGVRVAPETPQADAAETGIGNAAQAVGMRGPQPPVKP